METASKTPRKFPWTALLVGVGAVAYVLVAGTTRSCPACSLITSAMGLPPATAAANSPTSGPPDTAPPWSLKDLDGRTVTSGDLAGKVVLVDFWATWCPPCRMMIPGLVQLQEKYRGCGLVIVGISLDEGGAPDVKAFNEKFQMNYLSLLGDAAVVEAFGGVSGIPTSFLIDRSGRIVNRHTGYLAEDKLEAEILPLL